ncbi:unnamed protein product, partial [Owenia fusiformis]
EYDPKCGHDGSKYKTYGNKCAMDFAICESEGVVRFIRDGECPETRNTEEVKSNCNKICTLEYDPKCGHDGTKYKTYGNKCAMDAAICESGGVARFVRNGECPEFDTSDAETENKEEECNEACTREYNPMCGHDGTSHRTFSNRCTMEFAICKSKGTIRFVREGECPNDGNNEDCDKPCTREYNPVCGQDGTSYKTYPTRCIMEVAICKSKGTVRFVREGECYPGDRNDKPA